jgi:hypothetical protein
VIRAELVRPAAEGPDDAPPRPERAGAPPRPPADQLLHQFGLAFSGNHAGNYHGFNTYNIEPTGYS